MTTTHAFGASVIVFVAVDVLILVRNFLERGCWRWEYRVPCAAPSKALAATNPRGASDAPPRSATLAHAHANPASARVRPSSRQRCRRVGIVGLRPEVPSLEAPQNAKD
jgi:hypothetical protein